MIRALLGLAFAAAACGHAATPPNRSMIVHPALPSSFELATILRLKPGTQARLRVDTEGHPFLVTKDSFVPVEALPGGALAKAFRIANVSAIGDVAWVEGIPLVVVGKNLGVIGPKGYVSFLELPVAGMHVAAAPPLQLWLYGDDGHLYVYDKSRQLAEILRAPAAIRAVSGTPELAYVAVEGSLLQLTSRGAELVFDTADPIRAIASTDAGVFFSTANGTFLRTVDGEIKRVTKEGATEIAARRDSIYFQFDGIGIVRGGPISALSGHADASPNPPVSQPPPAPAPITPSVPNVPAPVGGPPCRELPAAADAAIRVVVCSPKESRPLEGVTVVAVGPQSSSATADANGEASIAVSPGDWELGFYYANGKCIVHVHITSGKPAPAFVVSYDFDIAITDSPPTCPIVAGSID